MLVQYTAAALASENKVLAHPASADSIPTCARIVFSPSQSRIQLRAVFFISTVTWSAVSLARAPCAASNASVSSAARRSSASVAAV